MSGAAPAGAKRPPSGGQSMPAPSRRRRDGEDGRSSGSHNSHREESRALRSILGGDGDDVAAFFDDVWQAAPRVYRQHERKGEEEEGDCDECPLQRAVDLGWDGVAALLERSWGRFVHLDNDDDGDDPSTSSATTPDPPLFFRNQTPLPLPEITSAYNSSPFAAYLDGCSVVVNHADLLCPQLAALCEDLQRSLPHCCVNCYLTPPGAQAVPAHADDRDVFVVQLVGEKVWRVYEEVPIRHPYPNEQVGKGGMAVPADVLDGPTVVDTTLQRGDVLYLPRGYVHEAKTASNQPSFHATVAVATHDWTLAGNLTELMARTLRANPEWRVAVDRRIGHPDNNVANGDGVGDGDGMASLQAQIDKAMDAIRTTVTAERLAGHLRVKYAAQRELCSGARTALMQEERTKQQQSLTGDGEEGAAAVVVGANAARRVFLNTRVRAATAAERAGVTPPSRPANADATAAGSDRGLAVREETSGPLLTMMQRLKMDGKRTAKVVGLRSLLEDVVDANGIEMVCDLTLLSFVRAAVELGAVAIAEG